MRSLLLPVGCFLFVSLIACSGDDKPAPAPGGTPPKPAVVDPKPAPTQPAAGAAVSGDDVKLDISVMKALFGSEPPGPVAPRSSKARVDLGKQLYHDKRLSKGGDISCASCHSLDTWGQDNKPTSPGTGGQMGKRNTPTTFNAARQFKQFWDYRSDSIEDHAKHPVVNPIEHGVKDEAELVNILKGVPEYVEAFKTAFPKDDDAVTVANFGLALGAFQRTLQTRSRFDDYLDGNEAALTNDEKRGLKAFVEVGCTTCHISRLVGGSMIQKHGLVMPVELADKGRYEVTKADADKNMFKVPSLLNVEHTAPYYHNGSKASLEEVTRDMAKIQLGRTLTDAQTTDIVTFMKALSGKLIDK